MTSYRFTAEGMRFKYKHDACGKKWYYTYLTLDEPMWRVG